MIVTSVMLGLLLWEIQGMTMNRNFRGEFDEQIDRNHGHYCGKYGNRNVLYLVLQE